MRKLLTVLSFASVGIGFSQNSLSLDSCISWSKKNYPLIKQNEVTLQQTEQNEKAIRENWLPKQLCSRQQ